MSFSSSTSIGKQRSSCNRCHLHKLRCIKRQDTNTCIRCANAASPCVFSQSRQGTRPRKKTTKQAQPLEDEFLEPVMLALHPEYGSSAATMVDTPVLEDFGFSSPSTDMARMDAFDLNLISGMPEISTIPDLPLPSLGLDHDLAVLSQDIRKGLQAIPPLTIWDSADIDPESASFQVDKLFVVTQTLADIYLQLNASSDAHFTTESFVFLVLSCHHRLFDMWKLMFQHMRRCIDHQAESLSISVPSFEMGAFKSSPYSTVTLQTALMVQFAKRLHRGIRDLYQRVTLFSGSQKDPDLVDFETAVLDDIEPEVDSSRAIQLSCRSTADRAATMVRDVQDAISKIPEKYMI
ncbi:hypothetical protein BT63DRAFT_202438 [Microthyrium microscopicum]|uniref:Zn(2)-C6 fungal-type domain-containing protein n=1 Tax=Microthyrium microscopicum TaxID=703497 RepID=A0A6A6UGY6_9PEZI|nr:hypothetical protein BT63DRAFT_202438 [Microthyrium microscopicum]